MANVKSFYGMKRTQHKFFLDAVNEIKEKTPDTAYLLSIGPPTREQDSNVEEERNKNLVESGLPYEVTGKIVVQYTNTNKSWNNPSSVTSNEKISR